VFQAEACAESDVNQLMSESDGGTYDRTRLLLAQALKKTCKM
jgi:hypothetical protein